MANKKQPTDRAYAKWFTSTKGVRYYAEDYGHKAWPLPRARKGK